MSKVKFTDIKKVQRLRDKAISLVEGGAGDDCRYAQSAIKSIDAWLTQLIKAKAEEYASTR